MSRSTPEVGVILELLQRTATLSSMRDYLRSRSIPSSASSWEWMIANRLKPSIKDGSLTSQELYEFLARTEEHGAQHVFLYKCDNSALAELLNEKRLKQALSKAELTEVFENPRIVTTPVQPVVTEVRRTEDGNGIAIKVVERRIYMEFLGEEAEGKYVNRRYERTIERAVNVANLRSDGLLELRIASHKNSSKYANDVNKFWDIISPVLQRDKFAEISLNQIKGRLWSERAALHHEIRFSTSTLRNDLGTTLRAASGTQEGDLVDDEGASSSLSEFMNHDAYCDSSNVWFKSNSGTLPSADIHVIFGGEINEFAIPARCNQDDYEHILNRIRSLNS